MPDPNGNTYGPFDVEPAGSYAESFTEQAWYREHDEGGVVSGGALTFSGLTAQLAAIHAYSHGSWLVRDATWTDTSPATTGPQPRRDLMVIRRTLTVGTGVGATPGSTVPLVLRGTLAAAPVDPVFPVFDPTTDESIWSWQVPASGGTVVTSIRDFRRHPLAKQPAASGRSPLTTTGKVVNATALTGVITVPAVAVPARVVFTALGRAGFAAGARSVAWDWDNVPASATNVDDDYDGTQVDVAASQWTTVVASLTMDVPAGVAATARLLLRSSGDAYNRGAVVWQRSPVT